MTGRISPDISTAHVLTRFRYPHHPFVHFAQYSRRKPIMYATWHISGFWHFRNYTSCQHKLRLTWKLTSRLFGCAVFVTDRRYMG